MLDEGVRRLDLAYARALQAGQLTPDPSLIIEEPEAVEDVAEQIERAAAASAAPPPPPASTAPVPTGSAQPFTIQVDTPTEGAVTSAEISVSRIGGVTSALATTRAPGGTSVIRVTFVGEGAALAAALQAQGWNVSGAGSSLRISRPGGE
jgi:hypothetical protein